MMDTGSFKYWAFISYSHRDYRAAAWLQRALEGYRVPRRLVGRSTSLGPVPRYLKPIFSDRSELQAGADLGLTVREALASSRFLIVVCSPDAVQSKWVEREIIEFKKLHGESRVLAVIAAGEAQANYIPGRETEECFPAALQYALTPAGCLGDVRTEPLAADLRPHGDGKRHAMLKLLAGMLGVGVDELVRRDAQRRARRMTIIGAASLVGMAVMSVLTVMAVRARAEAQAQRAQAEDLIEFMLGDLRKRLDPVGRLDALDSVGEKALTYYARQDPKALSADGLGRRSRALHMIGEIRQLRGNLDDALTAFTSAAMTTGQLLQRSPNDGQRIFDHAQSVYWVGNIAWQRGQLASAEDSFKQYAELAQRLVRIDPGNLDWAVEPAYADQNLGVVQLDRSRPADALQSFTAARDIFAAIVPKRPSTAFDLADAIGWVAKAHEATGDYRGAVDVQQARRAVLKSIADPDRDTRVQIQLANASFELARLKLYLGDASAAEPDAGDAVGTETRLVGLDSSNMESLSDECFDRLKLAEIELALGEHDAAGSDIARVRTDAVRLVASDPTKLLWQVILDGRIVAAGASLALAEHRPVPGAELEAYLARIRRLEASGTQFSGVQSEVVAGVELLDGDNLLQQGQRQLALARWADAEGRLKAQSSTNNYHVLTLLGRVEVRLDKLPEARALAAHIDASEYRHLDYTALVHELARRGT
jgi:tetratricopeptide (TPR) repeat protein